MYAYQIFSQQKNSREGGVVPLPGGDPLRGLSAFVSQSLVQATSMIR